MSKWVDDGVVETNEFELHDVITTLYHMKFECNGADGPNGNNEPVIAIVLNSIGYSSYNRTNDEVVQLEEPFVADPKDVKELEDAVNELIAHMHRVDVLLHDLFGYTC